MVSLKEKTSNYKRKLIEKVTEVVEVSQLDCGGSGSYGSKSRALAAQERGRQRECTWWEEREGEGQETVSVPPSSFH